MPAGGQRRASSARHLGRRSPSLIPNRRWPRRLLILANVSVAVFLIAAGGAYAYVKYRLDSIKTLAAPSLTKDHGTGEPENILLIGNETRAGLTNAQQIAQLGNPEEYSGTLSDVIMILHLDPTTRSASIISIPRDMFTEMPAGSLVSGHQKIDAALNDGADGPNNLIQAIQQNFGIPINHFVELNFDGFENTVNALGGIDMDFPEKLYDAYSLLNIDQTGCLHLNGTQALALVRSRHLQYDPPGDDAPVADWPYDPESDLARIVRDHTFLRVLYSTAIHEGLGNPIKLNDFIGAIINQITVDPGLKSELVSLASTYKDLNPNTIPETTLPVVTVNSYTYDGTNMGDVDFPVEPQDDNTIKAWDSGALPTPAAPTSVTVLNDVGSADLAGTTAAALTADGMTVASTGNGTVSSSPSETLVDYSAGSLPQAVYVLDRLDGSAILNLDPSIPAGTVTVEAGTTFSVAQTATASDAAPGTPAGDASGSASISSTTTVPTVDGQTPSASADNLTPYDPRPCSS